MWALESVCPNISSDRLSILVHSCIFASFLFGTALKPSVWDKGVPSLQVSDKEWQVKLVLEVAAFWGGYPLLEALQQCEAASCPRHTIVVPWPKQPSILSSLLSIMIPFNIFHTGAVTEAQTTCSSVWLQLFLSELFLWLWGQIQAQVSSILEQVSC